LRLDSAVYLYVYIIHTICLYCSKLTFHPRMSEVISVRVRKGVKEALERAGINVSEAVREYLEDLAWRATLRERLSELDRLIEEYVKPSPEGFAAESVRRDRDEGH